MNMRNLFCTKSLILFVALFGATHAYAEKALIAVAANFTGTALALEQAFEQASEHQIQLSFGSSGKLYAQIVNGAPYDVFLSADQARPERLETEQLGVERSRFTYALGQLLLWSPRIDVSEPGLNEKLLADVQRFAIANPATAPYGYAARESLQALGLFQVTQKKLVRGDSVAQAFQFIATGNAQAGLIAKSQWLQWQGEKGYGWTVPTHLYQPIAQQAILLKRAEQNPAAQAFMAFLISPKARSIIAARGYALPDNAQHKSHK